MAKFYEIEDLHVKLTNAGVSVDDNTLYLCFIDALPTTEYALEIRDLNMKQDYNRREILNLRQKPSHQEPLGMMGDSTGKDEPRAKRDAGRSR